MKRISKMLLGSSGVLLRSALELKESKMSLKCIVLAAGLGLTTVPAAAAETLRFDVAFHDELIAARSDALSVGDRVIINDDLLQNGTKTGTAAGLCTITDTDVGLAICNVSFVLHDGTISVQFVNAPPPRKEFAILGGSGAYHGVSGSGILIENGDMTGSLELMLDLEIGGQTTLWTTIIAHDLRATGFGGLVRSHTAYGAVTMRCSQR